MLGSVNFIQVESQCFHSAVFKCSLLYTNWLQVTSLSISSWVEPRWFSGKITSHRPTEKGRLNSCGNIWRRRIEVTSLFPNQPTKQRKRQRGWLIKRHENNHNSVFLPKQFLKGHLFPMQVLLKGYPNRFSPTLRLEKSVCSVFRYINKINK